MIHDQTSAARNLALAVVVDAMNNIASLEDIDWVLSKDATFWLRIVGLSESAIFALRLRLLLGRIDFRKLDFRKLDAGRFGENDKRLKSAAEAGWQAWPVLAR